MPTTASTSYETAAANVPVQLDEDQATQRAQARAAASEKKDQ
jgi:hypothetical protein